MKKLILMLALASCTISLSAQEKEATGSDWTLNTRAYSTNYWTSTLYSLARFLCVSFISDDKDSVLVDRILPGTALVFPIGVAGDDAIRGPYDRAFANPFKHIGDYAIGLDASYHPGSFGVYGGCYFKSAEVVFKGDGDNMRGFYIMPRVGVQLGKKAGFIELGAFYDALVGYSGMTDYDKDALKSGVGLDFALGYREKKHGIQAILQFSLPLHNFFNKDYELNGAKPFADVNRRVSYLMFTTRKEL